jgi:murein DD-endopeptidase MepM/ murein hydrolase activator NlpD
MGLNPFKESNLSDLQLRITQFLSDHFSNFINKSGDLWRRFVKKGNERITVMFIPHTEKKIINFHISIFAISTICILFILTVTVTSILIINHSSTIKEVSKLKRYGSDYKVQIKRYQAEISQLYTVFQRFKPEISELYGLTPEGDANSLWAKGGAPGTMNPGEDISSPPMEILNLQEMENELKITKNVLQKIKRFIEYRRKVLENTPSIWPVDGFIVSRFGEKSPADSINRGNYNGIEIEAFPGMEIKSTAPGKVSEVRWDPDLGLTIMIRHKYGFITSYSHCQRASVAKDQVVSKNEVIGYVGRTGKTAQYGCFYQIIIGTEYVDPMPYLNKVFF